MAIIKYCCYRGCRNSSRNLDPTVVQGATFYPFPKPKTKLEKCKKWLRAIGRDDLNNVDKIKKFHYVCNYHFEGRLGPTDRNPDPIPYGASENKPATFSLGLLNHNNPVQDMDVQENQVVVKTEVTEVITPDYPDILMPKKAETFSPDPINNNNPVQDMDVQENKVVVKTEVTDVITPPDYLNIPTTITPDCLNIPTTITPDCLNIPTTITVQNIPTTITPDYLNIPSTSNACDGTSSTNVGHLERKFENLNDIMFQFMEYQVKNMENHLTWCVVKNFDCDSLVFNKTTSSAKIGSVCVEINSEFEVKVVALGNLVRETSSIWNYGKYYQIINNFDELLTLLAFLDYCSLCGGIPDKELRDLARGKSGSQNSFTNSLHSNECHFIYITKGKSARCEKCGRLKRILAKRLKRRIIAMKTRNIKFYKQMTDEQKYKLLNENRKEIRKLKRKIIGLERKLEKNTDNVANKIQVKNKRIFCEFMEENLFISKENFKLMMMNQQRDINTSKIKGPSKWNPEIIKWCLYLCSKSPSAYDALRDVFDLPARGTLYPYLGALSGKRGFSLEVIHEMRAKIDIANLEKHDKYFAIVIGELKIKKDLIYKANTGELFGFCHLNEAGDQMKQAKNEQIGEDTLDRVVTLMVRGLTTNFQHILGYFPCNNMTQEELHSIVEEAIEILENNLFKVLVVISDKPLINQKTIEVDTGVHYKVDNVYAPIDDPRSIFYVSDPCYLIKAVRNCFADSGKAKHRLLRKNGKQILWEHVMEMYNKDCQSQIRLCPKLTDKHISLGPFHAKKVKFSTQIMSKTVASAIEKLVGEEATETVKFISFFNRFFDILNTKNVAVGRSQMNEDLNPFCSLNDSRFKWLEEEFLGYLNEWRNEVDSYPDASPEQRNTMLLNRETLDGIQATVCSVIGAVKFLLNNGAKYVLTERFNKDPLRRHFDKHGPIAGCQENPVLLTLY